MILNLIRHGLLLEADLCGFLSQNYFITAPYFLQSVLNLPCPIMNDWILNTKCSPGKIGSKYLNCQNQLVVGQIQECYFPFCWFYYLTMYKCKRIVVSVSYSNHTLYFQIFKLIFSQWLLLRRHI